MTDFPAPLVPADVDLTGFSGFMLDVDQLFASELVAIGTPEECWAAHMLMCRAWKQSPPGSLPDDPRVLAAFSGAGKRWPKIAGLVLRDYVKCSDGRLYHRHLAIQAAKAWKKRQQYGNDQDRLRRWREEKRTTRRNESQNGSETVNETACETRFETVPETVREPDRQGQGQGQGQKIREEGEPKGSPCPESAAPIRTRNAYPEDFERFWTAYPTDPNMSKVEAGKAWERLSAADRQAAVAALPGYAAYRRSKPDLQTVHAVRFLKQRRFDGFATGSTGPNGAGADAIAFEVRGRSVTAVNALEYVIAWKAGRPWNTPWGPAPDEPGCIVPRHILEQAGVMRARAGR